MFSFTHGFLASQLTGWREKPLGSFREMLDSKRRISPPPLLCQICQTKNSNKRHSSMLTNIIPLEYVAVYNLYNPQKWSLIQRAV